MKIIWLFFKALSSTSDDTSFAYVSDKTLIFRLDFVGFWSFYQKRNLDLDTKKNFKKCDRPVLLTEQILIKQRKFSKKPGKKKNKTKCLYTQIYCVKVAADSTVRKKYYRIPLSNPKFHKMNEKNEIKQLSADIIFFSLQNRLLKIVLIHNCIIKNHQQK